MWWDADRWWPTIPREPYNPPVDFDFVTDRIATGGGIWTAADVERLQKAGITHVICTASELAWRSEDVVAPRIPVLVNGRVDDGMPKDPDWFRRSILFAIDALQDPSAKVYAHCWSGKNRGPSTAYAIMRAIGYPPEVAEELIRKARPEVRLRYIPDVEEALEAWA